MTLTITNQNCTASFAADSAVESFIVRGHELIGSWQGSNGKPSSSMTMFPCVGMISASGQFVYNGTIYTPGKHGYLRGRAMEVVEAPKLPRLIFKHHHHPKQEANLYPFENMAAITHELEGDDTLATYFSVFNHSLDYMYFGGGLHPAAKWGADANGDHGDSFITLDEALPEGTSIYRTTDGKVSTKNRDQGAFKDGRVLALMPDEFKKDAYFVVLPDGHRRKTIGLTFSCPHNPYDLRVILEGWDGFGLWSKPGAASTFLCIEPLLGVVPIDDVGGDTPRLEDIWPLQKLGSKQKFLASMHLRPIFKG